MGRYKFSLDSNPAADDDLIFSCNGMQDSKVVIDSVSLGLISGSTIDYVEEMMSSSFRVKDNPNSKQSCGCGSSFEPKKV
jgi:iron-sulfur cluster assembly accessory protein